MSDSYTPHAVVNDFLNQWLPQISGKNQTYQYCLKHFKPNTLYNVVAIGKASVAMTVGLLGYLNKPPKQLLCISKTNHLNDELQAKLKNHPEWHYLEAAHPVIEQSSLHAGDSLITFLESLDKNIPLLFLISGGSSALVEKLPMGITLDFLKTLNQYLLASGLAINEINQVRKRFSLIKDGRLLSYINSNNVDALYLSDVAGNDISIIGSGLLAKSDYTKTVVLPKQFNIALPNFKRKTMLTNKVNHHIVFDLERALKLASKILSNKKVYRHKTLLFKTVQHTQEIVSEVITKQPEFDVYIFGSEATIALPKNAEKGGRNQHLALSFAEHLPVKGEYVFVSIGTDGTDGDTPLAGAWVDKRVVPYTAKIKDALKKANSFALVNKLGLGIHTGATGCNVMDVIMVFKIEE